MRSSIRCLAAKLGSRRWAAVGAFAVLVVLAFRTLSDPP
jgi:hypothetical protein